MSSETRWWIDEHVNADAEIIAVCRLTFLQRAVALLRGRFGAAWSGYEARADTRVLFRFNTSNIED